MSAKKTKKTKKGRPTKYQDVITSRIAKVACRLGAIDKDLAEIFDVNEDTINEWKKVHPDFSESIKEAKSLSDEEIETALHKRAKGYSRNVQRVNKYGEIVEYEEELPPDPTSMIFWLKNRRPERWKDKQQHEVSGRDGSALIPIINVSIKEK